MTEDPDMLAGELALGLLTGDERAAALRRVLAEPAFAAEVEWWRNELAALVAEVPEVEPSEGLLARIERGLDGRAMPAARGWVWPSIAGLTSIAAAVAFGLLLTRPLPTPVQVPVARPVELAAAAITPTGRGEPVSAVYEVNTGDVRLRAASFAREGRSAQLWVIGADGVPHSLGLLKASGTTRLRVTAANRRWLAEAATLAISIEPVGGSPTNVPTGPVVAKGILATT